jgi:hypothetical protein
MRIDGASASAGPDRPTLLKAAINASEYEKVFNVIPPDIGGGFCPQWGGLRSLSEKMRRVMNMSCSFAHFSICYQQYWTVRNSVEIGRRMH